MAAMASFPAGITELWKKTKYWRLYKNLHGERDRKNRESGSPASPSLIWGLELEAAVHLLGFHLVVLVHQVQLAVTQSHSFLILPVHHRGRWQRRRRALLALRLDWREVRSSPGRDAVRWRRPPEVVALFFFAEEVWELVEEQVWGSPLLGVGLAVVDGGGALGLGVVVHVGRSGDEPAAGEQARFVVVQTQRLELGGGAAYVRPLDVRLVGLVPLDAHLLTVGRRRSVHSRAVIGYSVSGDPRYRCDVTRRRRGLSSSPLRAQVRVVVGLLLVVALGDLVHRVRGHPGRSLHARHAVTGLAAGVFGAHPVPLPAGGEVHIRLSVYFLLIWWFKLFFGYILCNCSEISRFSFVNHFVTLLWSVLYNKLHHRCIYYYYN